MLAAGLALAPTGSGCSEPSGEPDAAHTTDTDAGSRDASAPEDAGLLDGGAADAGTDVSTDAAPTDASLANDVGSDAGCGPASILRGGACVPRTPTARSDFDGDGRSDVPVGAYGSVSIFSGRDRADPWARSLLLTSPRGSDPNFGGELASTGDTNGDGFDDLAVMERGRGYVWHFRGGAGGLDTSAPIELPGCTTPSDTCDGESLSAAGDVDGDGLRDLIVVRSVVVDFRVFWTAYLFRGATSGLETSPAWSAPGASATGAGDVDSDGFDDLVVLADYGHARVVYGSATGPSARETPLLGSYEARGVRAAGDVNGDGVGDLVLLDPTGAPRPRLLVYLGARGGLAGSAAQSIDIDVGPAALEGEGLASPGDLDGDGRAEVALAISGSGSAVAEVRIWWGSDEGLALTETTSLAEPTVIPAPMSGTGDVDGDGLGELVVGGRGGTPRWIGGITRGGDARALVLSGASGVSLGNPL
jgi:hypothetical protein